MLNTSTKHFGQLRSDLQALRQQKLMVHESRSYLIVSKQLRPQDPQIAVEALLVGKSMKSNPGNVVRADEGNLAILTGRVYLAQLGDRKHQARFREVLYAVELAFETSGRRLPMSTEVRHTHKPTRP